MATISRRAIGEHGLIRQTPPHGGVFHLSGNTRGRHSTGRFS